MSSISALLRPRVVVSAAGVLCLALTAAACSGTAKPAGPAPSDGALFELSKTTPKPTGDIDSFTWANHAEPFSLDYAYAFDYPPNQILANVCESLLRWNPDLSITPRHWRRSSRTRPRRPGSTPSARASRSTTARR